MTLLASLAITSHVTNLIGIAHLAYRVSNIEKTVSFYSKLGFKEAFRFEKSGQTAECFIKVNDRQFLELYPRTASNQPLGFMHVCFESPDLKALHDGYQAAGLNPTAVKKGGAGNLMCSLQGPEGRMVEFTQYLPGSKHWADFGKHLVFTKSDPRISSATIVVRDPSASATFFKGKLGFDQVLAGAPLVRLPGGSAAILFASNRATDNGLYIRFENLKRIESLWKSNGVPGIMHANFTDTVRDPDGSVISFEDSSRSRR